MKRLTLVATLASLILGVCGTMLVAQDNGGAKASVKVSTEAGQGKVSADEKERAEFETENARKTGAINAFPYIALAAGFALGIAAFGGALGQSRAIAATVEAIARQPEAGGRIFTSMIIGLALIETLVIYTLIISILLLGKLAG